MCKYHRLKFIYANNIINLFIFLPVSILTSIIIIYILQYSISYINVGITIKSFFILSIEN